MTVSSSLRIMRLRNGVRNSSYAAPSRLVLGKDHRIRELSLTACSRGGYHKSQSSAPNTPGSSLVLA